MLTHPTIEKLHALHLTAMAAAFDQQRSASQYTELSFEDRFGLLVETEWTAREQRRLAQRLRNAKLRYPASLEDVDFTTPRGLHRDVVLSLGTGAWIRDHHNLLITGPTGIGKSWLASACVQSACRHGFTATYVQAVGGSWLAINVDVRSLRSSMTSSRSRRSASVRGARSQSSMASRSSFASLVSSRAYEPSPRLTASSWSSRGART